ncbi:MAG: voltage-gated chloride channel protein [Verrucomicrobia bacterium]|nr:voltage-gated chloride channel protein [Verrucomicrobiota bacterium]
MPSAADHSPRSVKEWTRVAAASLAVAAVCGCLSALFLRALDWVTAIRFERPYLIWALPVAGLCTAAVYRRLGGSAGRGNDLIVERIRQQNGPVQARMTPLIFSSTLVSHLCGASVGREGAAVQIGGGLAGLATRVTSLPEKSQRAVLVAGVAAGFASIFGTPLAGAVFAVELATPRRPMWHLLPLAAGCAFFADWTAHWFGITHAAYSIPQLDRLQLLDISFLGATIAAAVAFGLAGKIFIQMQSGIRALQEARGLPWWIPPIFGGALLVGISCLPGMSDYQGLGTWSPEPGAVTIPSAFTEGGALAWSWMAKLSLTAIAVGTGFKGGEVTPLFFAGATLGNAIAGPLGLPVALSAGLGFVAVFAGAAHTPLTGAFLAAELFGWRLFPLFGAACWIAHWSCRRRTLYISQERSES